MAVLQVLYIKYCQASISITKQEIEKYYKAFFSFLPFPNVKPGLNIRAFLESKVKDTYLILAYTYFIRQFLWMHAKKPMGECAFICLRVICVRREGSEV